MKARESCADKLLERRNVDIVLLGKQDGKTYATSPRQGAAT